MVKKYFLCFLLLIMWSVSANAQVTARPGQERTTEINYTVKMVDRAWSVVDQNEAARPIQAAKSDVVNWTVEGSTAVFQFPFELNTIFEMENGQPIGSGFVLKIEDGKKLTLKIKEDAPPGRYVYSVFIQGAGMFAQGRTPPVIIIR